MDNPAFIDSEVANGELPRRASEPASSEEENGKGRTTAAASAAPVAPAAQDAAAKPDAETASLASVRLRRTLGLFSATAIIVGTVIGSGIFISPGVVLSLSGGALGPCLLVWASCGLLCTLASLAYIELGCLVPHSGGEFAVLLHVFGPLHDFLGPLPAFLFAWMTCLVSRPANTAVHSLAVAEYCVQPWFSDGCRPPPVAVPLVALCVNSLAAFVNSYSVRLSAALNNTFTAAKLTILAGLVVGGAYFLARGGTHHLTSGLSGGMSIGDLPAAFYTCLWAYEGWNNLNFVTDEMSQPARDMPRALGLGVPLVTACYLLVNTAYLTVLSPEQVMSAPAVAVVFTERALGSVAGVLVPICVAFSVYGTLTGTVLATSRLTLTAARAGHLAQPLGLLQTGRLTPTPAVLFNAFLAAILLACGDLETLITFSSFTVWMFYGLAMAALLVMRRSRPDAPRPFRVPTLVPWLVLVMAAVLMAGPVVHGPQLVHLSVLLYLLAGVLFYWQCVYLHRSPPGSRQITVALQKLLLAASQQ